MRPSILNTPEWFIIAPTWESFKYWCKRNGVDPYDPRKAAFITSADRIEGYRRIDPNRIVFVTGWQTLRGSRHIEKAVAGMTSKAAM